MTSETIASCLPCGLHEPRRTRYFDGRMLLDRDFVAEQDYQRGQRHLHNATLHGTGTACGLKVVQHPSPDCRRDFVVVEPGTAVDCCGQEIVVPERSLVRVRELIGADPDLRAALDGTRHLLIAVRRCDHGVEQVPAILAGCAGDDEPEEYGRIAESFEFVLLARAPAELEPVVAHIRPRLTWEHTITLGGQAPRRVHLNGDEDLVQLAADADAGGSHLDVHRDANSDLVSRLEGPQHLTDTASMREARLLLAAGEGFDPAANGIAFWRREAITTSAESAAVLPIDGRTIRLAVSPVSGTVFALFEAPDGTARLSSYAATAIVTWLGDTAQPPPAPIQTLELAHGLGGAGGPAQRGAAMLRMSHDGRFLALTGGGRVYIVEVAAFHAGGMTPDQAAAPGIPAGTDAVAVSWSLDDQMLYVLSHEHPAADRAVLHRYAMRGDRNTVERRGRGVFLDGTPRDLAVAPTELRAYVLLRDPAGISRLSTVDMARVQAVTSDEPEHVELSADAIRIDGDARSLALAGNGGRLYVAAADAEPQGLPDRGLVAVVDIQEEDCSVHLDRQIEGCPGCGGETAGCGCGRTPVSDTGHAVVLAHLPLYKAPTGTAEGPRMVDAAEAGTDDVAIDNLAYRPLLPSVSALRDVVLCMLARGIDEGPPGPRGDPGRNGTDGLSITDVRVVLGLPGSAASATVAANPTGLTLTLNLPGAAKGDPGPGIDDARITYADVPAPKVAVVVENGRRILDIVLPQPAGATVPVNSIVGLSWPHAGNYPAAKSFGKALQDEGIAVAFAHPVTWPPFTGSTRFGPTMLVELQQRLPMPVWRNGWADPKESATFVWATIGPLHVYPITDYKLDDHLLTDWTRADQADEALGFVLRATGDDLVKRLGLSKGETLRLVFYTDFTVGGKNGGDGWPPLSGGHIGGRLPTGAGGPGDTFRSWFTIVEV
ncbi:hypothetical protein AB0J83_44185 [Actinoplanes sp. NPDC049596]|uniref:hypothetical protein n=1 Tax=unclassified Actinoplanes TaxID=2626549 RepID=UPI00344859C0